MSNGISLLHLRSSCFIYFITAEVFIPPMSPHSPSGPSSVFMFFSQSQASSHGSGSTQVINVSRSPLLSLRVREKVSAVTATTRSFSWSATVQPPDLLGLLLSAFFLSRQDHLQKASKLLKRESKCKTEHMNRSCLKRLKLQEFIHEPHSTHTHAQQFQRQQNVCWYLENSKGPICLMLISLPLSRCGSVPCAPAPCTWTFPLDFHN